MMLLRHSIVSGGFIFLLWAGVAIAQTSSTPSTIIAKQGDQIVTLSDVDAFAQTMPAAQRPGFFNSPQRLQNLIINMLLKKQLAAEARSAGIDKDPEVKPQLEQAEEDVLARVRMQRYASTMKLPDLSGLAKEEYAAHKEKYQTPGKLMVRMLFVSTSAHPGEDVGKLAESIHAKAVATPGKFGELVGEHSDDPTRKDSASAVVDLTNGEYPASLLRAAKALRAAGEISPVVATATGFYIVQLVAREEPKQKTYAEVQSQIEQTVKKNYVDKQVADHTDQLRNLPSDVNTDLLDSLRTRYAAPADAADSTLPAGAASPVPTQQ